MDYGNILKLTGQNLWEHKAILGFGLAMMLLLGLFSVLLGFFFSSPWLGIEQIKQWSTGKIILFIGFNLLFSLFSIGFGLSLLVVIPTLLGFVTAGLGFLCVAPFLYLIQMGFAMIMILPLSLIQGLVAYPLAQNASDLESSFRALGTVLLILLPFALLIQGMLQAYAKSAWMLVYGRLRQPPSGTLQPINHQE